MLLVSAKYNIEKTIGNITYAIIDDKTYSEHIKNNICDIILFGEFNLNNGTLIKYQFYDFELDEFQDNQAYMLRVFTHNNPLYVSLLDYAYKSLKNDVII